MSDRVVSLCLCWSDDKAEGEVVLPTLHTGKEEETVAACERITHFVTSRCMLDHFTLG